MTNDNNTERVSYLDKYKDRIEDGITYVSGDLGELMVLNSSNLEKCVEVFNKTNFGSATLGGVYGSDGYNLKDLDILKKISAKKLIISPWIIEDYSGLYSQKQLEYLRLTSDSKLTEIDFARLPSLKEFEGFWSRKLHHLFESKNLEEMTLIDYKPKSKTLTELAGLVNIRSLALHHVNVKSLHGLEKLTKLRKFTLGYDRSITDLTIPGVSELPIEELRIWSCKNINFETLAIFKNVKSFNLSHRGEIQSLEKIMDALPLLEELVVEETKIVEGNNLYFLKHPSLKKISIEDDRKHFLLKEELINEALRNPSLKSELLKKYTGLA